jgi:hypothetical protein
MHMGFSARFGENKWIPYAVFKIDGDKNDPILKPNELLKGGVEEGGKIADIQQFWVDERTHYRVTRNPDGSAQYLMERRMAEDGNSYVAYVLDAEGRLSVSKAFERVADGATMKYLEV